MNYYRKQSKNASLRGEKWVWLKIVSFTILMLAVAMFGPEIVKFLN
jgi:hypothetical protein